MGQNKEKRYYNEKKKSVDEVFFASTCKKMQKSVKDYPWVIHGLCKKCKKICKKYG